MPGWNTPIMTAVDGAVYTHTQFNTNVRDNLNFLKQNIALEASTKLTISGGIVTKTKSYHTIDVEGGEDPTDDLNTINGGEAGDIIYLRAEDDARTIVIKDQTGNIHIGGDIVLDDEHKVVVLMYSEDSSEWHNIGSYSQERVFVVDAMSAPAPGTDWTPSLLGMTLVLNKTDKIFWIPLAFFKIGDQFISYNLVGDLVKADDAKINCKLVRINKTGAITSDDIDGGAIAEINTDGNFDVKATLSAAETIATDKQYVLQITASTGTGDSIVVMGAELTIVRLR